MQNFFAITVFLLVAAFIGTCSVFYVKNLNTNPFPDEIHWEAILGPPENIVNNTQNSDILNQQLRALVQSKGFSWDEWIENRLPRAAKWEITVQNSKNILNLELDPR
jgi:hypothetical protein